MPPPQLSPPSIQPPLWKHIRILPPRRSLILHLRPLRREVAEEETACNGSGDDSGSGGEGGDGGGGGRSSEEGDGARQRRWREVAEEEAAAPG